MARRYAGQLRSLRSRVRLGDSGELMDTLLALDHAMIEFSMRVYKVPRRDRERMRKQNRRLHAVVRKHLPRLLGPQ